MKSFTLEDLSISVPTSELAGAAVGLMVGGSTVSGITAKGTVQAKRGNGGIVGRLIAQRHHRRMRELRDRHRNGRKLRRHRRRRVLHRAGGEMHIQNCTNEGAVTSQAGVAPAALSASPRRRCRGAGTWRRFRPRATPLAASSASSRTTEA